MLVSVVAVTGIALHAQRFVFVCVANSVLLLYFEELFVTVDFLKS